MDEDEAKGRLSDIVSRASAGDEVFTIEREGKLAAVLLGWDTYQDMLTTVNNHEE
jgi:PHD/YefM family antitoxin component YafN of YafNO toxin-antitoxin module